MQVHNAKGHVGGQLVGGPHYCLYPFGQGGEEGVLWMRFESNASLVISLNIIPSKEPEVNVFSNSIFNYMHRITIVIA